MRFKATAIPDVVEIEPSVYEDDRGSFFESYSERTFLKNGIDISFVQDNQSLSDKNVIRGLHFQRQPFAQGKLVRVIKGAVLDIAVDIRKGSPYYGKYVSVELNEHN
ncbi:MAG: dTDP-4-dehydrorhamnose 3,5-epimerase family protein, partial [Flavobacteriales bacterium]|nr:dTDP-4-dehydrorhamnose 3,5-epimerase family protein [Flavobacteriales bacterium]